MGRRDLFEVTQLVSIKSRAQVFTPSYFLQTLLPPESFVSTSVPRDLRWSEARNGLIRKVVVLKKTLEKSQVLQDLPVVQGHKLAKVVSRVTKGKALPQVGRQENKLVRKAAADHCPSPHSLGLEEVRP